MAPGARGDGSVKNNFELLYLCSYSLRSQRAKLSKQKRGDRLPTDGTDRHGNAGGVINDNGDKLRPNQLPWALKENGLDSLDICPQGKEKF